MPHIQELHDYILRELLGFLVTGQKKPEVQLTVCFHPPSLQPDMAGRALGKEGFGTNAGTPLSSPKPQLIYMRFFELQTPHLQSYLQYELKYIKTPLLLPCLSLSEHVLPSTALSCNLSADMSVSTSRLQTKDGIIYCFSH